ncbi:MAG: NAD-dependent epimerase/dehydratase family protein [Rhodocyclaceae bacterium]|nr:NAD-dependent epimerase/dehydratase family protein [Rhodocyclaceae bacterium]
MTAQRGTAVVYGGSGFLGSHVADALTDAGYGVRIFDRMPSPYLREGQQMVVGDLLDADAVAAAAAGCDFVYNFAGIADIDEAKDRPLDTANVNVVGNLNALEAARLAGARRFVFASTVYVYSEAGSFYRASKQSAERFVEAYYERYGLAFSILRYGSLYGRRADERNGIYRLLRQALEKSQITYAGSPDAMREYIHVGDAARLSVRILDEAFANRHLILTGPERMPVGNLMRMVSEMIPGGVALSFGNKQDEGHYVMTPYAFHPKVGHKLVSNDHVDLGQGLLDCLAEMHERGNRDAHAHAEGDWLVADEASKL